MARKYEKLKAVSVTKLKKAGLHSDGAGLYLRIGPTGAKSWIFRYMKDGKSHDMGLGPLHTVSLAKARTFATEHRLLLRDGIDPIINRKGEISKEKLETAKAITFAQCAAEYIDSNGPQWKNPKHVNQWRNTLATYVYPVFGDRPVQQIDIELVLKVLRPIWQSKTETASRVRGRIENILDAARVQGYREGEHPYVYLDGIVLKRTWAGEVRNVSVLVATGVGTDGYRRVLGIAEGAKEDKAGWSSFLSYLKERGLRGVELIISDACIGLIESAAEHFPAARWQRCVVHFYRNVFSVVPRSKLRDVADMLKAIHAQEDLEAAVDKSQKVIEKLTGLKLPAAAKKVEDSILETLTYYQFPKSHQLRIRTNNPLERIMREIRRRTRVVGAFPDGNSALMLCAARLRHIAGTKWGTRKYLNMDLLKEMELQQAYSEVS